MSNQECIAISVVVPLYNAEKTIIGCLSSLLFNQNTNFAYEVVVVNNNSLDSSAYVIANLSKKSNKLKILNEPIKGSYIARNKGAFLANGRVLAFTDSDCVPSPNWLQTIYDSFQNEQVDAIIGPTIGVSDSQLSEVLSTIYEVEFSEILKDSLAERLDTRNCAIRTSLFRSSGGFKEYGNWADAELGRRLRIAGHSISYNADMKVSHYYPNRIFTFARKHRTVGYNVWNDLSKTTTQYQRETFPELSKSRSWKQVSSASSITNLVLIRLHTSLILGLIMSAWANPFASVKSRVRMVSKIEAVSHRIGFVDAKLEYLLRYRSRDDARGTSENIDNYS